MPRFKLRPIPIPSPERCDVFWSKIRIQKPTECWMWTDATNKGYGHFGLWDGEKVQTIKAHRMAFCLWYGGDPMWAQVLHSCDTPTCCNPEHLFLGDDKSNAVDKVRKGRSIKGEDHHKAKLEPKTIFEILKKYPTMTGDALAAEYGVHPDTIRRICSGRSWKHLERPRVWIWAKKKAVDRDQDS